MILAEIFLVTKSKQKGRYAARLRDSRNPRPVFTSEGYVRKAMAIKQAEKYSPGAKIVDLT